MFMVFHVPYLISLNSFYDPQPRWPPDSPGEESFKSAGLRTKELSPSPELGFCLVPCQPGRKVSLANVLPLYTWGLFLITSCMKFPALSKESAS